ncbi:MAG: TolC family protein [Desulforhopalus sp.]
MSILVLVKKRMLYLLPSIVLCMSGCSTPDTWYDVETLYRNRPAENENIPVDNRLLPQADWPEKLPLPQAEDGRISLGLEQAVFFALQRNRELQVERYTPLIVGTYEQIERGLFDPEFFGEFLYREETASEISRSTEERFSVDGSDEEAATGISQQLPTGTAVDVSVDYAHSRSNRTPEQYEVRLGLSVTQSLLRGFGPVVNLVGIRQAQLDSEASLYELRGFIEALIAEVETTYWRYVLATEGITILERSLDIARQQLSEVENRIEVGVIPKNSAAAAQAEVARREQELLEGRSIVIERRLRLLRLLNVTEDKHFQLIIEPTSQPRTVAAAIDDLDERLQLAARLRPDLNEARLRHRRQSLEVIRTRNGLLPKLDLFIDLGKTGYAESFNRAWTNIDQENYDFLTGIRLSSYLDNRTAKGKNMAARASRDQALAALENLQNMVQLDVRLGVNEVERTRQQIAARTITRKFEEQTLQAEQEKFQVGDTTSLLVAQAQRDLLVSQLSEIEAIVEYRIALVNLYLAEGSLLERRGILLHGLKL